jgi:hypothetical protein
MLFAYPTGMQGNAGTNELPNYKQTWGNTRKIAAAPNGVCRLSFKSQGYSTAELGPDRVAAALFSSHLHCRLPGPCRPFQAFAKCAL